MNTIPRAGQFDEMLVHVTERDADGQRYGVMIQLEGDRQFEGVMSLEDYNDPPRAVDPKDVLTYGLNLFNRLFAGRLSGVFQQAWAAAQANQRRLRLKLWLHSDNPRLHRIPWELMHYDSSGGLNPAVPLSTDNIVTFSRYLESNQPARGPIERRPIRMLVVLAEPSDLDKWALSGYNKAAEQRDLTNRFSFVEGLGQLKCDFLHPASEEALHAALINGALEPVQDADQPHGYDVLLYYGHALHHPTHGSRLLLEDNDTGAGTLYDGGNMVALLQQIDYRPSIIVMVGCNTATQSNGPSLGSLASNLVKHAGIPAVLAMQRLVEIPLARNFTFHLSDYMLRDGIVDVAVNMARQQVYQRNSLSWSTPVLYMRNKDGRLFSPYPRLEYIQQVLADKQFLRWSGNEFINVEVIAVPLGLHWSLFRQNPDDAPPLIDVITGLRRTLQLDLNRAIPNIVALIGTPRSGQTTAMQRLTWKLADESRTDAGFHRPVGIFVPLEDYVQQRIKGNRLEGLIVETVARMVPDLAAMLQRMFQESSTAREQHTQTDTYVFILDGLDDVQEKLRPDLTRDLLALARRLPSQRFVITCVQDFLPAELADQARVLILQPLSERQVLRYLRERDRERSIAMFRQIVDNRMLDLAADPALLSQIYKRLVQGTQGSFTRNQLLQDVVDDSLEDIDPRYTQGDAARETLLALAWELSWSHRPTLPLAEVFEILAQVRRNRDYNLEELYQALREARLIADVGQRQVRFVQPIVQTYCTALALSARPDFTDRLIDIIAMCGVSQRLSYWENTIYTLAGLIEDPRPLILLGKSAIPENSSSHTLLLARCLEDLTPETLARLSERDRQEFIDACVLRLDENREPSAKRRTMIATALGRLPYPQSVDALRRLLTEKRRSTENGPRYDMSNVRIAAARGLRTLITKTRMDGSTLQSHPRPSWLAQNGAPGTEVPPSAPAPPQGVPGQGGVTGWNAFEPEMLWLLQAWESHSDEGVHGLRAALLSGESTAPERALAAFALGDLAACDDDAWLLLNIVVQKRPDGISAENWIDTLWATTDALTLFDAELVAQVLVEVITSKPRLSRRSLEQLAYLCGRVRVQDIVVIAWLFDLFVGNPNPAVKGKALQSLAWLGRVLDSIQLPNTQGPLAPVLRQSVRVIAAGGDKSELPTPLSETYIITFNASDPQGLYLRRKALESLAWIGDEEDMHALYPAMVQWPLSLRETWYITAASIHARPRH